MVPDAGTVVSLARAPRGKDPVLTTGPRGRVSPFPGERSGLEEPPLPYSGLETGHLAPWGYPSALAPGTGMVGWGVPVTAPQHEHSQSLFLCPFSSPGRGRTSTLTQQHSGLNHPGKHCLPQLGSPFPVLSGAAIHGRTCLSHPTGPSTPRKANLA